MIKAILTHIIAIAHSVNVIKVPLVMNVHGGAVDVVDVVQLVLVQLDAGVVDLLKQLLGSRVHTAREFRVVGHRPCLPHAATVGGTWEAELVVGGRSCNTWTWCSSGLWWDQVRLAVGLVGLVEDQVFQRVVDLLVLGVLAAGAGPAALHVCLALRSAAGLAPALGGQDEDQDGQGDEGACHDGDEDLPGETSLCHLHIDQTAEIFQEYE